MIYYYIIFLASSLLSLLFEKKGKTIVVVLLILLLSFFAGTRLNIDNDYLMYYKNLLYIDDSLKDFNNREISIEYNIFFLPHFFEIFFNNNLTVVRSVFLTFAFLGVSTKLIAIKKYSDYFFLSVVSYMSYLYFMMEMTTIRAGVAAGFYLLSIKALEEKNNKVFFALLAVCFFFHNSSILFLLPWILNKLRLQIKYYYLLIGISFLSAVFKINILTVLLLDRIFPRVDTYINAMEWMKEDETNIFNFRTLFALLMVVLFAFFYKKLKDVKYFDLLFKIHMVSIIIFFFLSTSAQVFSTRSFELLSVVQILLYPMILKAFHPKLRILGWTLIFAFSLIQLYYIISVADIYKPYKSWFFN